MQALALMAAFRDEWPCLIIVPSSLRGDSLTSYAQSRCDTTCRQVLPVLPCLLPVTESVTVPAAANECMKGAWQILHTHNCHMLYHCATVILLTDCNVIVSQSNGWMHWWSGWASRRAMCTSPIARRTLTLPAAVSTAS